MVVYPLIIVIWWSPCFFLCLCGRFGQVRFFHFCFVLICCANNRNKTNLISRYHSWFWEHKYTLIFWLVAFFFDIFIHLLLLLLLVFINFTMKILTILLHLLIKNLFHNVIHWMNPLFVWHEFHCLSSIFFIFLFPALLLFLDGTNVMKAYDCDDHNARLYMCNSWQWFHSKLFLFFLPVSLTGFQREFSNFTRGPSPEDPAPG